MRWSAQTLCGFHCLGELHVDVIVDVHVGLRLR